MKSRKTGFFIQCHLVSDIVKPLLEIWAFQDLAKKMTKTEQMMIPDELAQILFVNPFVVLARYSNGSSNDMSCNKLLLIS
jgi:hypothetical protein